MVILHLTFQQIQTLHIHVCRWFLLKMSNGLTIFTPVIAPRICCQPVRSAIFYTISNYPYHMWSYKITPHMLIHAWYKIEIIQIQNYTVKPLLCGLPFCNLFLAI